MSKTAKIVLLSTGLFLVSVRLFLAIQETMSAEKQNLSLAQYLAERPAGNWFEFSEVQLDISNAVYFSFLGTGEADEIFIPAYIPGDSSKTGFGLVVRTDNAEYVDHFNALNAATSENLSGNPPTREIITSITGYRATLREGEDKIYTVFTNFQSPKLLLEEGAGPPYDQIIVFALVWLIMLFILIRFAQAKKKKRPPAIPKK